MQKGVDHTTCVQQVWARCFAALGISYKGATMNLDLCDREGKYSNGMMPCDAHVMPM